MKKTKTYIPWITTFLMSLFFVAVSSYSTSPLFYGRELDSHIFQYIGFSMLHGKIPYTDLFDHKGLLLYWINAIGYIIHPRWGLMLLQTFHLTLSMMIWYKILKSIKNEWTKYLILITSLIALYAYYNSGNLTEEWCLLFISYPILAYFESQKNNGVFNNKQLFFIGVCLGAIAMIRLNNTAPVLGILLCCLIKAVWKKEYKYIERALKYSFLGFIILPILGCFHMFCLNGFAGIDDMFYAAILFNLDYAANSHIGSHLLGEYSFIYKAILPMLFLLPSIKKERQNIIVLYASFVLTALTIGGASYIHYLEVFIPLLIASFACMHSFKIKYASIIILVLLYSKTVYRQFDWSHFLTSESDDYKEAFDKVIAPIPMEERGNIWNMCGGYMAEDFMCAGLLQQNRILLPFQMSISDRLYEEENEKIQKIKPKYVLFAIYSGDWQNQGLKYHKKHGYAESDADLKFVLDNYKVLATSYLPDGTQLFCYHLKDTNKNRRLKQAVN